MESFRPSRYRFMTCKYYRPILEAFTSDQSIMKSRLMTFSRTDLLYMPVLKVNNSDDADSAPHKPYDSADKFLIVADETTFRMNENGGAASLAPGIIKGASPRMWIRSRPTL